MGTEIKDTLSNLMLNSNHLQIITVWSTIFAWKNEHRQISEASM